MRSSIVFNYGHITIPRHLRDIVITEYGIAGLRGKTDSEVAAALIEVADSRFQEMLIRKAKQAGKLCKDYKVPGQFRNNFPEIIQAHMARFRSEGLFPSLPFEMALHFVAEQENIALKDEEDEIDEDEAEDRV